MRQFHRHPHLRIYHPTQSAFTQQTLDMATIVVSLAGLISAILFLVTMG